MCGNLAACWQRTSSLQTRTDKGKKVVTFFKSSTIGRNDLAKVQKELYDLGIRLVEARMQDEVVIHAYYV
jgi:hypothetical protein